MTSTWQSKWFARRLTYFTQPTIRLSTMLLSIWKGECCFNFVKSSMIDFTVTSWNHFLVKTNQSFRVARHSAQNMMTEGNLATCFGPVIFRSARTTSNFSQGVEEAQIQKQLVSFLITNRKSLFHWHATFMTTCSSKTLTHTTYIPELNAMVKTEMVQ